jgi:HlyD family secretion protein
VANLDELTLTVYVPEPDLGQVRLGQKAKVKVDAFPGEVFEGEVFYISPQAEFTPKSVQTKEERANLVFRVKIRLPNPDGKLKAGMPAEAYFSQ